MKVKRRIFLQQTLLALAGAGIFTLSGCAVAQEQPRAQAAKPTGDAGDVAAYRNRAKVGVNLMFVRDWSLKMPFSDLFKSSRGWISQTKGAAWGEGPALELRADGYPATLAPDGWAESPILTFDDAPPTAGRLRRALSGQRRT